jgi:hypothetical protein
VDLRHQASSLSNPWVVARNESGPRYVSRGHCGALRKEGFRVLEGIRDGLRDGRGEFDPPLDLVVRVIRPADRLVHSLLRELRRMRRVAARERDAPRPAKRPIRGTGVLLQSKPADRRPSG